MPKRGIQQSLCTFGLALVAFHFTQTGTQQAVPKNIVVLRSAGADMDFFTSFRERAQQAVNAASELATPMLAEAEKAVKSMADTVAADVQTVAADARSKARELTDEVEVHV